MVMRFRPMVFAGMCILGGLGGYALYQGETELAGVAVGLVGGAVKDMITSEEKLAAMEPGNGQAQGESL